MTRKLSLATVLVWSSALMLMTLAPTGAQAAPPAMKLEVVLVWATSLQATNKPVAADIKKELSQLPLKWPNYYQINQLVVVIPEGQSAKEALSSRCVVEIKNLQQSSSSIEVTLFGQGQQVVHRNQTLAKGAIVPLVGGNAPDATGWLVVLKRLE